jgi:hypothetical protein
MQEQAAYVFSSHWSLGFSSSTGYPFRVEVAIAPSSNGSPYRVQEHLHSGVIGEAAMTQVPHRGGGGAPLP